MFEVLLCVLAVNISTVQGLAKGITGVFQLQSLIWDPKDFSGPVPDLDTLVRGEIS